MYQYARRHEEEEEYRNVIKHQQLASRVAAEPLRDFSQPLTRQDNKREEAKVAEQLKDHELPKAPQDNYTLSHTMQELLAMSREQLASVRDFTIENQFGKIEFQQAVNLLGFDLETIRIEPNSV